MIRRATTFITNRMRGRMTVTEVKDRVALIRALVEREDEGGAHAAEDALYRDVLQAIEDGAYWPFKSRALVRAALEANEIDFTRWCG